MELITTVKDFPEKMRSHHISPDTHIRVIIDNHDTKLEDIPGDNLLLPIIKPKKQRRLLDLIPGDYQPGASEELIKIISTAKYHDMVLVANDKHMRNLPDSFVRENWAKF